MKKVFNYTLILTLVFFNIFCNGFNKILKNKDYNFKFKKANQYYDAKKYGKAQILYQDVINFFKETDQYEYIFYRLAYCSYYLKDNTTAQILFKEYISRFPQNSKSEEMDFMYAFTHYLESPNHNLDQSSTIKAMNLMQLYLGNYPNALHSKEAEEIISICKKKLEQKDADAAMLYRNAEQYQASAIYYNQLVVDFPESANVEEYKYKAIDNLYLYAKLSIEEKQLERYNNVLTNYEDFLNRFPESKYIAQLKIIINLTEINIKKLENESITKIK